MKEQEKAFIMCYDPITGENFISSPFLLLIAQKRMNDIIKYGCRFLTLKEYGISFGIGHLIKDGFEDYKIVSEYEGCKGIHLVRELMPTGWYKITLVKE